MGMGMVQIKLQWEEGLVLFMALFRRILVHVHLLAAQHSAAHVFSVSLGVSQACCLLGMLKVNSIFFPSMEYKWQIQNQEQQPATTQPSQLA